MKDKKRGAKYIPISAAKQICKEYGQQQVIIITIDMFEFESHVITYGKSIVDCENAARWGNVIKKEIFGWPEEMCHATPRRIKKLGRTL